MHISKDDFFLVFKTAFLEIMIKGNIQGGFWGAGLIPHNPDAVLSKLDVKLLYNPFYSHLPLSYLLTSIIAYLSLFSLSGLVVHCYDCH
jgi:hypothetical protein